MYDFIGICVYLKYNYRDNTEKLIILIAFSLQILTYLPGKNIIYIRRYKKHIIFLRKQTPHSNLDYKTNLEENILQ